MSSAAGNDRCMHVTAVTIAVFVGIVHSPKQASCLFGEQHLYMLFKQCGMLVGAELIAQINCASGCAFRFVPLGLCFRHDNVFSGNL